MRRQRIYGTLWTLSLCLLLLLSACGTASREDPRVVVASVDTLEQRVIGKMTVLALERQGYDVVERCGLGNPQMVRAALEAGGVDVCWGYTGDAWTVHLRHDYPVADADELFSKVHDEDLLNEITWLSPCEWENRKSLIVRESFAEDNDIETIWDLARYVNDVNPDTRLCIPQELYDSATGIRGLERFYSFQFKKQQVRFLSTEEGYDALAEGDCDCALGLSADAALTEASLRSLKDDKGFFGASNLAPVVRTPVLLESPDVEHVLVELSGALTEDVMREIHRRAVIEGQKPAAVARHLLRKCGM
ncbi:MAG: glycine betaine ABC transporter substrate-binding protein [Chloroflexota bacterium]|nr:glycine betaine ABC transporter substrate-binding protein [Chloroflexota bacterium]